MPFSIDIDPRTGAARCTVTGTVGLRDSKEAVAALWQTPGWSGRSSVWDFRPARLDISAPEVQECAAFVLHNQPEPPPARVAFVTTVDVDYGVARMFEAFRDSPDTQFRVFRDYEEAVAWAEG